MTETDYRIGIVGIGAIADHHAKAIRDIENATVVAGSCRTESKGRAFADEYDCDWYADYEDLLEEARPDVVTIATPSGAHLEPTLAAAERGVHVLCEKPLEITTERIDRMIDAADEAGVLLGGIFQQRFNDVVRTVRDAVAEGRFGDLSVANASVPWWRDDDYYEGTWKGTQELDGGGALMNQSIHAIDAIQWLVGAGMDLDPDTNPVEEVFAYTDVRGHSTDHVDVEDTGVAIVRYRDGTLGQLLGATSMYPGALRRLEVAGRNGTAEIHEDELATWRFRDERPTDAEVREAFSAETEASGASDPMAIDYAGHRRNVDAFLDAVDGNGAYELDGVQSRKAVAIIEAIYESAERGEPVRIS
ncbi:Gfo/Idh/MocA family oxidoreductase [Halomontanus rarus]|uniref:Gfo/Idh/MocA family oxidoreductase n=1 Tax=Halomontanus rarus TaxID=3034020 RepID=UPI001A99ADEF